MSRDQVQALIQKSGAISFQVPSLDGAGGAGGGTGSAASADLPASPASAGAVSD